MKKAQWIAGVDEAGRGPLAGPVVAAAVVLNPNKPVVGLNDSKKLSEKKRNQLFIEINENALAVGIGRAEHGEIDEINILHASLLAMKRAIENLSIEIAEVWVDGNRCPELPLPCKAIVGGDALIDSISAASIIAKVTRDREMLVWDEQYPEYGFAQHKGYPTKKHLEALDEYGILPIHRRSFSPVPKRL